MKKILPLLFLGFCTLLSACEKDTQAISPSEAENVAGTYYRTLTTSDGQERQFIVFIPASAAGRQDAPLLYVIHGTNQSGQVHYDKNLWNPKAQEEGFIVVYPTALVYCHFDNGEERTTTKWNAGDLGQTDVSRGALPLCAGEVLEDDMLFFDELSALIKSEYAVDEKRVYLTGFSNGAQMAARLAAQRSEVYAAATVHAGNFSDFLPTNQQTRPMSLFITVGANDGLFGTAVGLNTPIPVNEELMKQEGVLKILHPFLAFCALDTSYTYASSQVGDAKIASFLYQESLLGLSNNLRFVLIEGLGHSYTEELIGPYWDFLQSEKLP